jgi:glycosyltransferase involved in cell wall biosynthesis
MRITVALCTYNPSRELFAEVLSAVLSQVADDDDVIVVDNRSSPPVDSWLDQRSGTVKVLRQETPGLTAAREMAIEAALGEALLFVDDDNVVMSGYVDGIRSIFRDRPEVGVVGGAVFPDFTEPPPFLGEFETCLAVRRRPVGKVVEISTPPYSEGFPIGAGLAVRCELARDYVCDAVLNGRVQGRRGEALSSGEDVDLGLYALSRGYVLVSDGDLRIRHVIPSARLVPEYLERLVVGTIEGSAALEAKWSERLGQPIFPIFRVSLAGLLARYAIASILRPASVHLRLRRAAYAALIRAKRNPTSRA